MPSQANYIIQAFLLLMLTGAGIILVQKLGKSQNRKKELFYIETASTSSLPVSGDIAQGKILFQQNCASCHNIYKDGTGPGLLGFTNRGPWAVRQNVYDWIKNPSAFMQKNEYTRKLKEAYGSMMTAFPNLTDEEIDAICDFVDYEAERRAAPIVSK